MIHLTTHQLSGFLDGELPESSTELVRRHLESCGECTIRFAAFREQEVILDRVLVHDPGEDFFERFADRVMGEPVPVMPKRRDRRPDTARERSVPMERAVVERAVVERAVATPTPSEVTPQATPAPATARRPPADQPAVPWFAAAILCLIVGAIGYTLPRPAWTPGGSRQATRHEATAERTPAPSPARLPASTPARSPAPSPRSPMPSPTRSASESPEAASASPAPPGQEVAIQAPEPIPASLPPAPKPESTVREPASTAEPLPPDENVVPVRRLITTTEVRPTSPAPRTNGTPPLSVQQPAVRKIDEFAAAPPPALPLIAAARQAAQATAHDSSAANLDATGNAWERAVPELNGAQQTLAREKLAEARYRAWVAAPDPYRAAAATASLRTFVVLSPPGPRRELAKEWLRRINGN